MQRRPLPPSASLDGPFPNFTPGLVGIVEAVAAAMNHQGAEVDPLELIAISSAAFANYVFEPSFNLHEDEPREFSALAEMFSNYGPWGAIASYTGWQVIEVGDLPSIEVVKLAAFELSQDRPIVTVDEALAPTLLCGYEIGSVARAVRMANGRTLDMSSERLQADSEVFSNWLLLIRPGERSEWARSTARQRVDVLRWAVEHGRNGKEFFQETRENYAAGLAGFSRFREFLDDLSDPAGVEFAEHHVERLRRAREAAASVLPRWIDSIVEELAEDAVRAPLEEAARQFRKSQLALGSYETLVDGFATVHAAEIAAVEAMEEASAYFPSPFEA